MTQQDPADDVRLMDSLQLSAEADVHELLPCDPCHEATDPVATAPDGDLDGGLDPGVADLDLEGIE